MRTEVETILYAKNYRYFDLPLAARLLLVTDGTVTELLEAMLNEPITLGYKDQLVDNIEQNIFSTTQWVNEWQNNRKNKDTPYLQRVITLRGTKTDIDWLYAESVIAHESLSTVMQAMLIDDKVSIGNMLNTQTADNHRRIVDCGIASNSTAAKRLKLDLHYAFVYRVYHIMVACEAIMAISEWFPVERINVQMLSTN